MYDVNVKHNRGQYPLPFAPVNSKMNRRDDPKPTRPLSGLNTGGAMGLARFRVEYEDSSLLIYEGDKEQFFEDGHLRMDMKTKKWVRIYKGQEYEEHGFTFDQSSEYYNEKKP